MEQNINTDNKIFKYTISGVLLFIVAVAFALSNIQNIVLMQLSYTAVAGALGIFSFSLLAKAIKQDKARLKRTNIIS